MLQMVTGHWSGQCWRGLSLITGAGSAGDGQWSLEQAVLEMITGAGSAGNDHWSGQCWR